MLKYFKCIFVIFLLLFSKTIFSENRYFTWVDPKTQLRARINLETYELLFESKSQGWLNRGKIIAEPNIFNQIPAQIINNYFFFNNGNKIRFTIDGTGRVYDYFPLKKELIRIDNTFYSGYNFLSNKFIRNGILYSIGGEGFWNYNPNITYFDDKLKEWEILRPKNKGPIPIVAGYQAYNSKLDVYYSGGSNINQFLEDQKREDMDGLFLFDFKKNKWELLGKLNPDLPFLISKDIIWTGDFFLHFFEGYIYIINPQTNEIYIYKDNKKTFNFGYNQYVNKDTLITFWNKSTGPVQKISIAEIRSKSTYYGKFYSSGVKFTWYYSAPLLLIGIGSFFWWRQKRSNNNKTLSFTDLEKNLILKLLELQPDEYLTTHDINDILETNNKSQENQRKIRFKILDGLNNKLKLKFDCENGIERKSLPEDKRLIVYVLNQQIRTELKKLLK